MENFIEFFSQFGFYYYNIPRMNISDILDIAIVSYIIYKVLLWIKETRAWSLLKGIIIILIVSVLSYFFNLYTISWLISNTFNVGVIAFIIIFTPEIRKALEELGSKSQIGALFEKSYSQNTISSSSLDTIILACVKMAEEKTGAIIVIENTVALGDIANTGVKMDAKISLQLLLNIFEDKTPLHDLCVFVFQLFTKTRVFPLALFMC